ncbi:MAG: molybdopterin-dependent oxidoreductase [Candidatus Obscuribacterales bacterium]|nr:molybdopterin-dependent oxidoreductase [Candidatus Obscuribacterales bacterium]
MTSANQRPKTFGSWLKRLAARWRFVKDLDEARKQQTGTTNGVACKNCQHDGATMDTHLKVGDVRADLSKATSAPGSRRVGELALFPPMEKWDHWTEWDPKAWPKKVAREYMLVPTVCFNCEAACGLLAYVDKKTLEVRKFEGNPEHPGSRGRNCAKGPATINQVQDPERVLYPMKRKGPRGSGQWERVSWDEVVDLLASRIREAIKEGRRDQVMYHVGRPGEDGFTERVLAAWGVDGHNSHTNICSSSARAGYAFWMGIDRPSPDHANAKFILLISAHLESGHYFNPHAQRIIEAKMKGAKIAVVDPRLSNTASHADYWLPCYPGGEPAMLLAIAYQLIKTRRINKDFVRRWVNWEEYLKVYAPDKSPTFGNFLVTLEDMYSKYTPEFAAQESGVKAQAIYDIADEIARAGTAFSTHTWRASCAGNLGGWQTARCLFFLNVLTGSIATPGGTSPNAWNKFVPKPMTMPVHPEHWNEVTWPKEFPLAFFEMSFLLPHLLKEGRNTLDVYFTRVYNPVWTNPDGMSWIDVLKDESKVGVHCALTPVWNETAWFADYILPMGLGPERHDLHSYETQAATWIGFRQPVRKVAKERMGGPSGTTLGSNPGDVWEENEFWIELSWRIDPDGSLGIRKHFESPYRPGEKVSVDEYYQWIFENSVPGLNEAAEAKGMKPLEYMRRFGAFEVQNSVYQIHEDELTKEELEDSVTDETTGLIYKDRSKLKAINIVPVPQPGDEEGRKLIGVKVDGIPRRGFPTPSGKLEIYSSTLSDWGWPEYAAPSITRSHVEKAGILSSIDEGGAQHEKFDYCLIPTFRLPVLVHTRTGNAKWLNEIAHSNPLWINPDDAKKHGLTTGDNVRIETEIGYFVTRTWVTESIAPSIVACSHHMGRWRLGEDQGTDRWSSSLVDMIEKSPGQYLLRQKRGVSPFQSSDPDSMRVWWNDAGVHQNLTFPVQPDPISGMHCWHQKVRVLKAKEGDQYGDVFTDTNKAHEVYKRWMKITRPAPGPDGMRRPWWLLRPLRPSTKAYKV